MSIGADNPLRYLALAVLRRAQIDYHLVRTGTQIPFNSGGYAGRGWIERFLRDDSTSMQLHSEGVEIDCCLLIELDRLNNGWFSWLCEVAEIDKDTMIDAIRQGGNEEDEEGGLEY